MIAQKGQFRLVFNQQIFGLGLEMSLLNLPYLEK